MGRQGLLDALEEPISTFTGIDGIRPVALRIRLAREEREGQGGGTMLAGLSSQSFTVRPTQIIWGMIQRTEP